MIPVQQQKQRQEPREENLRQAIIVEETVGNMYLKNDGARSKAQSLTDCSKNNSMVDLHHVSSPLSDVSSVSDTRAKTDNEPHHRDHQAPTLQGALHEKVVGKSAKSAVEAEIDATLLPSQAATAALEDSHLQVSPRPREHLVPTTTSTTCRLTTTTATAAAATTSSSTTTAVPLHHKNGHDDYDDDMRGNEFFSFPCNRWQLQKQKDHFFLFVRVLLKYLRHKDAGAYARANQVMRQLAHVYHHQQHDTVESKPEGLALILHMYERLRATVSPHHWKSAVVYCRLFQVKKREQHQQQLLRRGGGGGVSIVIPQEEDF
mmetsp:Transcript_14217/g.31047  ORF Transcript_14217/g.31047 Transcript_14217/m.31047 type:complete len:318 (+) Transcript_14217:181-1134(+)